LIFWFVLDQAKMNVKEGFQKCATGEERKEIKPKCAAGEERKKAVFQRLKN